MSEVDIDHAQFVTEPHRPRCRSQNFLGVCWRSGPPGHSDRSLRLIMLFKSFLISIPTERQPAKMKNTQCQKWDSNPRPHSWTRTLIALLQDKELP
ncbi:hypothetical protein AVEN_45749-1 [Araneus ventricosus]|uniref:Uncharacterized protein n=1 Tax=Araneus ventricosus TaxID=182803 RepID=A0A4Y2LJC9_ARAVE|nr:hypothetical protein AVEN_45749-1 [Araneus ventricosus]